MWFDALRAAVANTRPVRMRNLRPPLSGAMAKADGYGNQREIMVRQYPKVLPISDGETETAVLEQPLSEHPLLTPVNNLLEAVSL